MKKELKPSEYIKKNVACSINWIKTTKEIYKEMDSLFISKEEHEKEIEEYKLYVRRIKLRILDRLGFDTNELKEQKK